MFGNQSVCKKFLAAGLCAVLLYSMSACQENPEGSIIVHKDMDNLISKAQEDDPSKVEAADLVDEVAENYEIYRTTIEDKNLGVTVNVNAKVDVPKVETLNVYRVEQKTFEQEFIDKVRKALMGEKPLYDGRIVNTQTRQWFLDRMAEVRRDIAALETGKAQSWEDNKDSMSEEEFEAMYQDMLDNRQQMLDYYQEGYESAAETIDPTQNPADGTLKSIEEQHYSDLEDSYYSQLYSSIPDGEDLNVISDGGDGNFDVLHVQNSEDYGGHLEFRRSRAGYVRSGDVFARSATDLMDLMTNTQYSMPDNPNLPDHFLNGGGDYNESTAFLPYESDTVTLTQEEAIKQAEDFLREIGMDDFTFADGGLYNEWVNLYPVVSLDDPSALYYRRYYILQFNRNIDGVLLTQSSGTKGKGGWNNQGGAYTKHRWFGECAQFLINDNGIVGLDIIAPIDILETVVENATLKSFEEVKGTFEKMICYANADPDPDIYQASITIDHVRLSYSRISEQDSFDTGLIVPVWSFEGRSEIGQNGNIEHAETGSLLTINAVDGSIIDSELGY